MRFANLDPRHGRPSHWDVLRRYAVDRGWRRRCLPPPGPPAPAVAADLQLIHAPGDGLRVTWLGHASVLLRIGGRNVLIDPVFSWRVAWVYRRFAAVPLTPAQLPPLDLLLVTHNHYDHLDAPSIAALPRTATVVVPSGLGRWFLGYGFARVVELGWWESVEVGGVTVTLTPARHWSKRGLLDTNASLWGGYVLQSRGQSVYHAGDTAACDVFGEIERRYPGLSAALLPIGGYAPQWFMQHNHFTPEEAGQAFLDCGARRLIPIHWGTFQLSDEPLREPIERLRRWWQLGARSPLQLSVLDIGATLTLGSEEAPLTVRQRSQCSGD